MVSLLAVAGLRQVLQLLVGVAHGGAQWDWCKAKVDGVGQQVVDVG